MFESLFKALSAPIVAYFKPNLGSILKTYRKTINDLHQLSEDKMDEAEALDAQANKLIELADEAEAESREAERLAVHLSSSLLGQTQLPITPSRY